MQLVQGGNVFFPHLLLGIGDKDDAVDALEDQFAGGIVLDLTGNGVELNFHVKTLDLSHVEGKEVKEQGPVPVGFETDHFRLDLFFKTAVDIFKICGLATAAGTVVDNFDLNDFILKVYEAQVILLLTVFQFKLKPAADWNASAGLSPKLLDVLNGFDNVESKKTKRDVLAEHADQQ